MCVCICVWGCIFPLSVRILAYPASTITTAEHIFMQQTHLFQTLDVYCLIFYFRPWRISVLAYWYSKAFLLSLHRDRRGARPVRDADDGRLNNWWGDTCACVCVWEVWLLVNLSALHPSVRNEAAHTSTRTHTHTHTVSFWLLALPVAVSTHASFNDLWLHLYTHTHTHTT